MGLEALRDTLSASKLVSYGGCMSDHWDSYKGAIMLDHSDSYRRHAGAPTQEEEELAYLFPGHKLSNSGPNMLLFWDVLAPHKLDIWCAEISLERRKESGEIWGTVEWSEAVMTRNPPPPHHLHCKLLYSVSLNL
ncbi:unnamed protein product [Microthlaspi erraticum]|uniref:Uncharacterized protein n=1 Tax=Microthlaspi erraticum TaxID=1685480 RepID=A0A6D2KH31_9BRAS|nr:unnamed protein product [Microthlaspi erraticum]CAA7047483.1 unnamed protein product [Microthlaspi erraticum]